MIPGLTIIENFITEDEETALLNQLDKQPWSKDISRKTQHYGRKYDYSTRSLKDAPAVPDFLASLGQKITAVNDIKNNNINFDQVIVNRYEPGEGIAPHVDHQRLFGPIVTSISLQDDVVMDFNNVGDVDNINITHVAMPLKRRSLLIMRDAARYKYTHGIKMSTEDVWKPVGQATQRRRRGTRTSITYRTIVGI